MMRKQDKNFKVENIKRIWNEKTKTRNKGYVLNCTSILFYFIISLVYTMHTVKSIYIYIPLPVWGNELEVVKSFFFD